MKITVAFCKHQRDKKVRHRVLDLDMFWDRLKRPLVRAEKDNLGMVLARFDVEGWLADPRRAKPKAEGGKGCGWMQNERVLKSFGYLGDCDHDCSFDEGFRLLDGLGVAFGMYTTHSSEPEAERFRFVIPFYKPLKGTPEVIAAGYGAIHDYFQALFDRRLDHKRAPAGMCHVQCVHPDRVHEYRYRIRRRRPLLDYSDIIKDAKPPRSNGHVDFPDESDLPDVYATDFAVPEYILDIIERTGGDEIDQRGRKVHRTRLCFAAYLALHKARATPAEIAAIIWNPENAISARWREPDHGYGALCYDIQKVLSKVNTSEGKEIRR